MKSKGDDRTLIDKQSIKVKIQVYTLEFYIIMIKIRIHQIIASFIQKVFLFLVFILFITLKNNKIYIYTTNISFTTHTKTR